MAGQTIWRFFAVFLRVGALVIMLPVFGERLAPARVRLVAALAFTFIVAPATPQPAPFVGLVDYAAFALVEILIGIVLGLGFRLFIHALQTAGAIAAQATSLSQIVGAANVDPAPALGHLFMVGGLALAAISGLHIRAAQFLILSYEAFPAGLRPDAAIVSAWGVDRISKAFSLAFLLAAPFVVASFIYNLALGAINRAMPQLMVAFVGAPAITWGGLFLLLASAPVMFSVWLERFLGFINAGGGLAP